jgi:hypothetical protein
MDFDSLLDFVVSLTPFACAISMIGGALGLAYYRLQARRRAWADLASRTGLAFEPGSLFAPPRVTGTYRQHQLTLDTFTRGSGKNQTIYTRIVIFADNRANVHLALYEEGFFSKVGKFFGREDVQTGDEEVDRRFIIKCEPEIFASRLFTSINLRAKLLEIQPINIEVDGHELHYERRGVEMEGDKLLYLFDMLIDLAEFVERA